MKCKPNSLPILLLSIEAIRNCHECHIWHMQMQASSTTNLEWERVQEQAGSGGPAGPCQRGLAALELLGPVPADINTVQWRLGCRTMNCHVCQALAAVRVVKACQPTCQTCSQWSQPCHWEAASRPTANQVQ
jgi:hypothetical protein